jgi:hypothetical protein
MPVMTPAMPLGIDRVIASARNWVRMWPRVASRARRPQSWAPVVIPHLRHLPWGGLPILTDFFGLAQSSLMWHA